MEDQSGFEEAFNLLQAAGGKARMANARRPLWQDQRGECAVFQCQPLPSLLTRPLPLERAPM